MEKQTVWVEVKKTLLASGVYPVMTSPVVMVEKKENVLVFTEEEYQKQIDAAILLGRTLEMDWSKYSKEDLIKAAGDAFDAGMTRATALYPTPSKDQYLNKLKL